MKIEVLDGYTQGMQNLSFNFARLAYYLAPLGIYERFFYYSFNLCCYISLRPMKHKSFKCMTNEKLG